MIFKISPLSPQNIQELPPLSGVRIATAEAGIKYKGRADLLFIIFDEPASVAGVFTRSKCPSAPVEHCRASLPHGVARGVVVNSGNANAFTGRKGRHTTNEIMYAAASALKAQENEIFIASTGVIGEPMDASAIVNLLPNMVETAEEENWLEAAKAIMTTDTFPKLATRRFDCGGKTVTLNGIAKGAGMIAPDMATMLSFVVIDAGISSDILQSMLSEAVQDSFNSITVDSDTSTSDTLMMFATGKESCYSLTCKTDPRYGVFMRQLRALLQELALQIVCDGEGARHLIEVNVIGATTDNAAKTIAFSIANSPLVKTAIAGEDANWGRVVMAVGKAGVEVDRDLLTIWFGEHRLAVNGERDPEYCEETIGAYMRGKHITIRVDIGLGRGKATVWSCDLTKEYVMINGDYRS
ncbi:bifunctional glutamate N-acetyltransferase/amino-acid acetyltransferase ArgJ [Bartonella vinsonii]|uniref:Arginine biosynthesis bifunctional protein ArgJ n=1 Tax=Bartonella vinsonii subsp. berkhoffii str. Tweed TaxID=1094502 RepID=N6VMY9_BARVB|nr:bifunctional glutamate N-acetyltransferase/amino-acid acetyltransferase ArgJ [Bartonella vinsonii]AGF75333.1 bifunctional ornithine acetyltransferase/N-acetylglutamate synthase protein [Bartonella vinsonii subsp. berkhoffii str. Winnie]ENN95250.1 bifunctional ornithine acetyltransferase/N-acetylglutamate synthase protein [Bartonella vinsonii subsp. berkhoffii str. Tweed]